MVSTASRSGPAAASSSSRGAWKSRSRAAETPYRPRYSDPSARNAPYGPTEAATSSPGCVSASSSRTSRARVTLSVIRRRASAASYPAATRPSTLAW